MRIVIAEDSVLLRAGLTRFLTEGGEEIVAAGRYIREPGRNTAEVAFLVQDEWQNKGMGSHLLRFLARCARKSGITQFRASVLRNNKAMLNVFHSSGYHVYIKLDEDVYNLTIDLGK